MPSFIARATAARTALQTLACAVGAAALLSASPVLAQTARDIRGADPVVPLASEPPAKLVIDPPLAEPLTLVDANHHPLDQGSVSFVIPPTTAPTGGHH